MDLSVILLGIASILWIYVASSALQVAQDNTSQLLASMYSNLTAPSLNGSTSNLLVQCNREIFGQDLHFQTCFEPSMRIPQVMDQMTFAMREHGQNVDIPFPYIIISCKSPLGISRMILLLLMQRIPADGLCAIDVGLLWGAACGVYYRCAKGNPDHIGGMAFNFGMCSSNDTTMK